MKNRIAYNEARKADGKKPVDAKGFRQLITAKGRYDKLHDIYHIPNDRGRYGDYSDKALRCIHEYSS